MKKERDYQMCSNCVMDTSDLEITFNSGGICNHCIEFEEVTRLNWFPSEQGKKKIR